MSEELKNAQEEDKTALSTGKRNALLRYMAILFGVAFLLVLLSFLIQMRDSRDTISDLHESNASALQNALQLQEENQALTAANAELTERISDLEAEAESVSASYTGRLEDLESQIAQAKTRQEEAEAESQATLTNTQAAYDLLVTAQAASARRDRAALTTALENLAPQLTLLSPAAQIQYNELRNSLTAEEVPPEANEENQEGKP
ncbi:MAG: hypothetical protein HFF17_11985 [Oscillospiraceae bacterium]|nr:hypothetical protein [Oscillospiraceae bacterium]